MDNQENQNIFSNLNYAASMAFNNITQKTDYLAMLELLASYDFKLVQQHIATTSLDKPSFYIRALLDNANSEFQLKITQFCLRFGYHPLSSGAYHRTHFNQYCKLSLDIQPHNDYLSAWEIAGDTVLCLLTYYVGEEEILKYSSHCLLHKALEQGYYLTARLLADMNYPLDGINSKNENLDKICEKNLFKQAFLSDLRAWTENRLNQRVQKTILFSSHFNSLGDYQPYRQEYFFETSDLLYQLDTGYVLNQDNHYDNTNQGNKKDILATNQVNSSEDITHTEENYFSDNDFERFYSLATAHMDNSLSPRSSYYTNKKKGMLSFIKKKKEFLTFFQKHIIISRFIQNQYFNIYYDLLETFGFHARTYYPEIPLWTYPVKDNRFIQEWLSHYYIGDVYLQTIIPEFHHLNHDNNSHLQNDEVRLHSKIYPISFLDILSNKLVEQKYNDYAYEKKSVKLSHHDISLHLSKIKDYTFWLSDCPIKPYSYQQSAEVNLQIKNDNLQQTWFYYATTQFNILKTFITHWMNFEPQDINIYKSKETLRQEKNNKSYVSIKHTFKTSIANSLIYGQEHLNETDITKFHIFSKNDELIYWEIMNRTWFYRINEQSAYAIEHAFLSHPTLLYLTDIKILGEKYLKAKTIEGYPLIADKLKVVYLKCLIQSLKSYGNNFTMSQRVIQNIHLLLDTIEDNYFFKNLVIDIEQHEAIEKRDSFINKRIFEKKLDAMLPHNKEHNLNIKKHAHKI